MTLEYVQTCQGVPATLPASFKLNRQMTDARRNELAGRVYCGSGAGVWKKFLGFTTVFDTRIRTLPVGNLLVKTELVKWMKLVSYWWIQTCEKVLQHCTFVTVVVYALLIAGCDRVTLGIRQDVRSLVDSCDEAGHT